MEGAFELKHNEVYQLGFRLAKKHAGQERFFNDGWYERYESWWNHLDEAKTKRTLGEHFLVLNDEEAAARNHGVYLTGGFAYGAGDEYPKINGFINRWYNRNLKIFANLARITQKPDERIVLIIGSGHLGILHHLVKASPAYELVPVRDYLGAGTRP